MWFLDVFFFAEGPLEMSTEKKLKKPNWIIWRKIRYKSAWNWLEISLGPPLGCFSQCTEDSVGNSYPFPTFS